MSSQSTAFALEQNELTPQDQLALIIISDCCGDYFSKEEAIKTVARHTSMSETVCGLAFKSLCGKNMLREQTLKHRPNSGMYFVMVVHNG